MSHYNDIFNERYKRLNDEQRKAVDAIDGPVMVIAGPGSGKTELLSLRVANILRSSDVRASNILCLTFTDAASVNMRDRLTTLIGPEAYRVAIHTFHSFGQRIIEENPTSFFGAARFSAADQLVQFEVIQELLENLPSDNPLSSYHPDQGFVYLRDIKSVISNLKRAAITPDEYLVILDNNKAFYEHVAESMNEFGGHRVNLKKLEPWIALSEDLEVASKSTPWNDDFYDHPAITLKQNLDRSIAQAVENQSTTPLKNWKKNIVKDSDTYLLKESTRLDRLQALADLYKRYEETLYERGLFDFDDMLVEVVKQLKSNNELLHEVAEQYEYILIDEFQDTNDAQLKLALTISRPELHEGRPNIMAVGDDDQAINRFQGADISNITQFVKRLHDIKFIVLTKNYRSHGDIIDLAKKVIRQGEDRLENTIAEIDKELVQANESITDVDIQYHVLPSAAHEYTYIANQVKNLIDSSVKPSDIAILGREHRQLQSLVTHLHEVDIPVRYERNLDVLKQKHIRELIQMARYVQSLADKDQDSAEELLPEILSYDFWRLDRLSIWQLSDYAYKNRISWQEAFDQSSDGKLQTIGLFFKRLSEKVYAEPAEVVLDYLIGSHDGLLTFDDSDEYESPYELPELIKDWTSPFKTYYFSTTDKQLELSLYTGFLSNLRVFVKALRDYTNRNNNEIVSFVKILDLIKFARTHDEIGSLLADTSPFVSATESVQVMTAHKSKGLEFNHVFILSAVDEVWGKTRNASKLKMPVNLPIEPAGTTMDDNLRLFFVAITRARQFLYLSGYSHNDKGSEVNESRFVANLLDQSDNTVVPAESDILTAEMHTWHSLPPAPTENSFLQALVEDYCMSVTHLNTFLDVTRGGPQTFFEQNLLHFPQAKSPSAVYGSAIHSCIEHWYRIFQDKKTIPEAELLIDCFNQALETERLAQNEMEKLRQRGVKALQQFYDNYLSNAANIDDVIEKNFKYEGVEINEISLTGKIDRIIIDRDEKTAVVSDFKTGSSSGSWKGSGYESIKLHNYRRQLVFYRILMNKSNSYKNLKVKSGQLEFVEPDHAGEISILGTEITDDEVERLEKLIAVVGNRIKNLDFPDVSEYPQTLKGIIEFEDSLIKECDLQN